MNTGKRILLSVDFQIGHPLWCRKYQALCANVPPQWCSGGYTCYQPDKLGSLTGRPMPYIRPRTKVAELLVALV